MRIINNNDIELDPVVVVHDLWNPLDYLPQRRKVLPRNQVRMADCLVVPEEQGEVDYIRQTLTSEPDVPIIVGSETGDDRVDVSQSSLALDCQIQLQSNVMKMKTSEEDTFISKDLWNYCETTSYLPSHRRSNFESARKLTNMATLSFVDVPAIRIVIDATKSDMGHSSTSVGKASMMGNRLRSVNPSNQLTMDMASWMQDSMLNINKSSEPKYLPRVLGGSNAPPLFGVPSNVYLSMKSFRGGTYSRVYGSAINELHACLDDYERHGVQGSALLCSRLRQKQDYLHGTYAESVMVPEMPPIEDNNGNILRPVYKAVPGINLFCGAEQRLLAAKRLCTRREAMSEIARVAKIRQVLFGNFTPQTVQFRENLQMRESRERYEHALSANAAFQRLLSRTANGKEVHLLEKDGFFRVKYGVRDLTMDHIHWLFANPGQALTINDLYLSEEMYLTEEVSSDKYFKVPGIILKPITNGQAMRSVTTTTKVGLWQISESMEEWADNTAQLLKQGRDEYGPLPRNLLCDVYNRNREWVADDTGIIAEILNDTALESKKLVFLVSHDMRLGRQAADTTNNWIVLVKPREILASGWRPKFPLPTISLPEVMSSFMEDVRLPPGNLHGVVYIDTGALQSTCMSTEEMDTHGTIATSIVGHPVDRQLGDPRVDSRRLVKPVSVRARVRPVLFQPSRSYGGRPDRIIRHLTEEL